MNKLIIAALAVLLAYTWAITAGEILIPLPEEEVRRQFKLFLHKFEKVYSVDETQFKKRLEIFTKNLEKVRYLNHIHNETIYGVTKFMDLDEEEFKNIYLSRVPISRPSKLEFGQFVESVPVPNDLPTEWDWTQKGAVTPVKNQGSCGSCWSFSATGNMEGQWFLAGHNLTSLSEQQLVDCDKECDPEDPKSCDAGCNGGLMMNAFRYAIKNGVESEKDYSYEGYDGQCRYDKSKVVAQFTDLKMLPTDEDQIAAYLVEHGPLAVALNANNLQFYMGGISDPFLCNPKALDHGVLLVGFGVGHSITGTKKYWLVKNSWGSGWGEHGYFRIVRGKSKCGINTYVCSALV